MPYSAAQSILTPNSYLPSNGVTQTLNIPNNSHGQRYPRGSETAATYLAKHEQKTSYVYDWKAKAACSNM